MPRSPYVATDIHPYHITARCLNKEWFRIPLSTVWTIFSDQLFLLHHGFNFRIHSFVLMSNHFHMILRTPDANLSEGMHYFMKETSRSITFESGRINQTYGARYHRCVIDSYHYYLNAYKYVYRNPIDAGLSTSVEIYPYSTLNGLLGFSKISIPLEEDTLLFDSTNETLNWLNKKPTENNLIATTAALKKSQFRYPKERGSNLAHPLEKLLL